MASFSDWQRTNYRDPSLLGGPQPSGSSEKGKQGFKRPKANARRRLLRSHGYAMCNMDTLYSRTTNIHSKKKITPRFRSLRRACVVGGRLGGTSVYPVLGTTQTCQGPTKPDDFALILPFAWNNAVSGIPGFAFGTVGGTKVSLSPIRDLDAGMRRWWISSGNHCATLHLSDRYDHPQG